LVDLGSSNGSRLNGENVAEAQVRPGDVITLGDCQLRYQLISQLEDVGMTMIESETDLDQTVAEIALPISLNETDVDRLVINTPTKTWEIVLDNDIDSLTIGRAPFLMKRIDIKSLGIRDQSSHRAAVK
jgi:hypothetical protein